MPSSRPSGTYILWGRINCVVLICGTYRFINVSFLQVIEVICITGGISSQTFPLIGSYNFSWICPTLVGLNKMKIFLVSADVTKLQIILHWWVPSNEHFRRSTWFQQNGWLAFRPLWSSLPVKINETKAIRRKTETGFKMTHFIFCM